ncbi:MAG: AmmeMemoRadiSam system protein A [Deltaproteobacteria bacterium]|nr:AmmeMemoRadiSam system protein A [Deltaproteobacteria bacterium]
MVEPTPLSAEERRVALQLARQAIVAALYGRARHSVSDIPAMLREPCGAFVTVYCRDELRGCVGTIDTDSSFDEAVQRLACAAALNDHRFSPLSLEEMGGVRIEISRLTPLRPARIAEIDVGVHGVCLDCDGSRAVFLPKVASEHGWDRSTLLTELCRKALLPDDAWMLSAASLFTFTAEVFDDNEFG